MESLPNPQYLEMTSSYSESAEDQTVWQQACSAGRAFTVKNSCYWDYTAAKLTGQRPEKNLYSAGAKDNRKWATVDRRRETSVWAMSS